MVRYSRLGVCPEGAQGVFRRKYVPNQDVPAGQSVTRSDDPAPRRLEIWIDNRIDGHDKLWTLIKSGAQYDNWVWRFRLWRNNPSFSTWHFVKKHTMFRTTSLELKTRVVLWRYTLGSGYEAFYNEHHYLGVNSLRNPVPAGEYCSSLQWQGLQGYSLVVATRDEADTIFDKMTGYFQNDAWFGADDTADEGHFRWVVGPESHAHPNKGPVFSIKSTCQGSWYCNWNTGEPNNGRGGIEHWVHYYWNIRKWNDRQNAGLCAQVCEFGGVGLQTVSQGRWYLEPSCSLETAEAGCESYQICRWNSETTACEENEC
eukprot:PhM_4_TR18696/c0_g5_i1/m.98758